MIRALWLAVVALLSATQPGLVQLGGRGAWVRMETPFPAPVDRGGGRMMAGMQGMGGMGGMGGGMGGFQANFPMRTVQVQIQGGEEGYRQAATGSGDRRG